MSIEQQPPDNAGERWRPTTKQVIGAVIVVVALVAVLQNTRRGHFNFLFFDFNAPVWVWLLVNFGAGFATGLLVARRRAHRASTTG